MNFVETLRGIGNVFVVMLVAGAVAYVGDRVGHQVGRRRLTLYGIRPRYTSTIVAIATGMVIALVVTLVAILASQEVRTALFRLGSLNAQIAELQTRQRELETKVNQGRLVLPVDAPMVPGELTIDKTATQAERLQAVRALYFYAVKYVNANFPRLGLRPYVVPAGVDKQLENFANEVSNVARESQANVILTVTSDQNLFANDQIHFGINVTADDRGYQKGQPVAQLTIPGKSGANIYIAINELLNEVSGDARRLDLPPLFADNVRTMQALPDPTRMQQMISKPGTYILTAYAAEDFYPHIGFIPVAIVLTSQPQ
jgi:hypothetical protein